MMRTTFKYKISDARHNVFLYGSTTFRARALFRWNIPTKRVGHEFRVMRRMPPNAYIDVVTGFIMEATDDPRRFFMEDLWTKGINNHGPSYSFAADYRETTEALLLIYANKHKRRFAVDAVMKMMEEVDIDTQNMPV